MVSSLSKPTNTSLKTDLLHFYDDIAELNDYCAFMCDALTRMPLKEGQLDEASIMGASRLCGWMKHRMRALKADLKRIHEKANKHTEEVGDGESHFK